MKNALEILEELESDGSRLFKEALLEECSDNEFLKRVLMASLNPYVHYGIAKFKMPRAVEAYAAVVYVDPESGDEIDPRDLYFKAFIDGLLPKLASRELRGNAARDAVIEAFSYMDRLGQKWAKRVLLQNLRAGIQAKTVNKVWPGLIPGFKVQLAYPLETSHDGDQIHIDGEVKYPVRVEPKLDGLRCIAIKKDGEVTMYTRNGRVIETLPAIKESLEAAPYHDIVLDGEAMGEDWNESASIVGSKKNKKDDSNIVFNVFDAVLLEDWVNQECEVPMGTRLGTIKSVLLCCPKDGPIRAVPGVTVEDEDQLMEFYEKCLDDDFEGVMLKDLDAPYEFKRSRMTRKMKPVTTYEGTIVGHYEGRDGTRHKGQFGGYTILLDNGVCTNVGGGFSDADRATIKLEDPDTHIGRIIEVEGQPPLTKDGRVRFPVFKRYRDPSDVDPKITEAYEAWKETQ